MPEFCRSCKAPIRWALNPSGSHYMPLNYEPDDAGEWTLAAARRNEHTPRAVHVPESRRAEFAGSLYVPHWATCPHADRHRRSRP